MKVTILIIFCFLSQMLFAQNTFFKNYKRPSHERAFSAVETPDGNFLLAGEVRQSGYYDINQGLITRISADGEIAQEKRISLQDGSRLSIIFPFQYGDASFLCIGSSDSIAGDNSYGKKIFLGIDNNMEIIYQKSFSSKFNYLVAPWQYATNNDTILYLLSDNIRVKANSSLDLFVDVVKYNLPFDSLGSYSFDNRSFASDLLFKNKDTILDIYVLPYNRRLTFDANLNYRATSNYPDEFASNICVTPVNDSNYLITGEYFDPFVLFDQLGCMRIDNYNIPMDTMIYSPSNDTNFYGGGRKNTVIQGNFIYIAGFYNVNAMWFPYNYNPSWVSVTKADLNLNMISTHFYGGDAQYCPFSIISTSDGGCFITGYSYDYINNLPNNNYELDIFALKTDADGLITELPDQPQAKAHNAILYPNPGIEYFNIQSGPQITGAELYMFDTQGKPVLNEKINNTQLKVNTANLAPGIYPWQIVFKNKVLESGKWVKK